MGATIEYIDCLFDDKNNLKYFILNYNIIFSLMFLLLILKLIKIGYSIENFHNNYYPVFINGKKFYFKKF